MRCSPRISSHGHMRQPSPRGVFQHSLAVAPTTPRPQVHTAMATPVASPRLGSATPRVPLYAGLSTPPMPSAQWTQQQAIPYRAPLGATPVSEMRSTSPAVAPSRQATSSSVAPSRQAGKPGSPGPPRRQTHFGAMSVFSMDSRACPLTSPRRASPPSSPRPLVHRGTSLSGRATPLCQPPLRAVTQPGTPPPASPRCVARRGGVSTPGRPQVYARPAAQESVRRCRPSVVATPVAAHTVTSTQPAYVTSTATSSKPPASQHAPAVVLAPGVAVKVSDHELRITSALGEGSFGTVWGARYEDGSCSGCGEVALKEIPCYSQQALADAVFEGEVLRALGCKACAPSHSQQPPCQRRAQKRADLEAEAASCMPSLIDMEVLPQGEDCWHVRIAMTRVPGEPLSRFIEERRPCIVVGRQQRHRALAEAAGLARELVLQLAPTFDRIATRAYHRDVTPRNILIDWSDGAVPRFGIIDFGLSVDSLQWRTGLGSVPSLLPSDGTPAWQHFGVAGDGRYWPVASWYMFELGAEKLSRCAGLELEYKMHLDFHSLGLSALQVLVEMAPAEPDHGEVCLEDPDDVDDELLTRLWMLQRTWYQYWEDATRFWQCIYDTFRSGGDFKSLKAAYVRAEVHESVRRNLTALRTTLALVRESAAQAAADSGLRGLVVLMDALMSMIGTGAKESPLTWGHIRDILEIMPDDSQSSRKSERRSTSSSTVPAKLSEAVSPPSTVAPASPISSASVDSSESSGILGKATVAPTQPNDIQKTSNVTARV
mmetsp:Transcript_6501/g.10425  ORF Transcript_6501/g.10425 Transcript_6501/m.10425 type:complete len:771 (-) Transcript_6501:156-2468(-)